MLDSVEVLVTLRTPWQVIDGVEPATHARLLGELLSRQWDPPAPDVPPFVVTQTTERGGDVQNADRVLRLRYASALTLPERAWFGELPESHYLDAFVSYAAEQLVFASRQLILCANLAAPGVFSALSFQARFGNGGRESYDMMLSDSLSHAASGARDRGWPPIDRHVELSSVWSWARSIPSFVDGVGETPIGRALAAFSHLFVESFSESHGERLFWALLGLEAIYARGREGLAEQLRAKSSVLLGTPNTHKKAVSSMYGFRSRFVHGDLDIPFRGAPFDELSGFTDKMDEGQLTGIALLLSTLQALMKSGRTEIEFDYKITK